MKNIRGAAGPVAVIGGGWGCSFSRSGFGFPCTRLWRWLLCGWEETEAHEHIDMSKTKSRRTFFLQYHTTCSSRIVDKAGIDQSDLNQDWNHTFLARLWGFPGRWIWLGVRLWARVGFGARQSRSRLLVLRVAVSCFLLGPWSRVWFGARRSLLRHHR